jgi:PIN domain nuclease of toxin-antitoxin system
MRLLVDTHALLWALDGDKRLSKAAQTAMESFENEVFVSAASAWEISTKFRLGKLPGVASVVGKLERTFSQMGFHPLPISIHHAERAGALRGEHRDPFDRMLIAQAQAEDLALLSNERLFDAYAVARIW